MVRLKEPRAFCSGYRRLHHRPSFRQVVVAALIAGGQCFVNSFCSAASFLCRVTPPPPTTSQRFVRRCHLPLPPLSFTKSCPCLPHVCPHVCLAACLFLSLDLSPPSSLVCCSRTQSTLQCSHKTVETETGTETDTDKETGRNRDLR